MKYLRMLGQAIAMTTVGFIAATLVSVMLNICIYIITKHDLIKEYVHPLFN